jgi:hypothetical protein
METYRQLIYLSHREFITNYLSRGFASDFLRTLPHTSFLTYYAFIVILSIMIEQDATKKSRAGKIVDYDKIETGFSKGKRETARGI